jgi:hypothetical protein
MSKTPKTEPRKSPSLKLAACVAAYEYWKKNPHVLMDDLMAKFKTSRRTFQDYIHVNNLPRADGRVLGKGSPRQQMIKEAYDLAYSKGETVGWAERYAEAKGFHVGKGDIRYYSMKNGLPDLKEAPSTNTLQASPHKQNL